MRVRDIMSNVLVTLDPSATIETARQKLIDHKIRHLVIVEHGRVAGVVSDRDLPPGSDSDPISTVMHRRVATVDGSATLRETAGKLNGQYIGCLIVLENDGELAGIVTSTDLLRAIAKGDTHPAPQSERFVLRDRGPQKKHRPHS